MIDAGRPRNAPAAQLHGYLSRDGTAPSDLLAAGQAEVARYGGEIVPGIAVSARRPDTGDFRVMLHDGSTVWARRLLVATGLTDELPDVPGLAQRWGRDVLHCPYCHGWEVRDQAIGVLDGPVAGLEVDGDELTGVRLAGGRVIGCRALVVAPRFTARTDVLATLGLPATEYQMRGHGIGSHVPADPTGATAVPGVWVAGNVTDLADQVLGGRRHGL